MPQGRGSIKKKPSKQKEPDLVVVTINNTKGGRSLQVGTTGNVKLTEAPTLLKLASRVAEEQLGLTQ